MKKALYPVLVVVAALLVIGVVLRPLAHIGQARRAATTSGSVGAALGSVGAALAGGPPSCAPGQGTPSATLQLTASNGTTASFTENCYSAPSGTPLTINFTNQVFAASDNSPIPLRLVVSSSAAPVWSSPDSSGLSHPDPGNVIATSPTVIPPGGVSFSVPALLPGTYYIQADPLPAQFWAVVVVQ